MYEPLESVNTIRFIIVEQQKNMTILWKHTIATRRSCTTPAQEGEHCLLRRCLILLGRSNIAALHTRWCHYGLLSSIQGPSWVPNWANMREVVRTIPRLDNDAVSKSLNQFDWSNLLYSVDMEAVEVGCECVGQITNVFTGTSWTRSFGTIRYRKIGLCFTDRSISGSFFYSFYGEERKSHPRSPSNTQWTKLVSRLISKQNEVSHLLSATEFCVRKSGADDKDSRSVTAGGPSSDCKLVAWTCTVLSCLVASFPAYYPRMTLYMSLKNE